MPQRVPGSRNFRFKRRVGGVGTIERSSGTADPVEFRYRDAILTKLIRHQALDILRAFHSGHLSVGDLVAAEREGRLLSTLDDQKLARPLIVAVEDWLPRSAQAPASRRRYRTSWLRLKRQAKVTDRTAIRDLERIRWKEVRGQWKRSGSDWNRMRSMVSAFLSDETGGLHNPFRLRVMGSFPKDEEGPGRVTEVSVADFWKLVDQAPVHVRSVYASLAILGTGPKEQMGIRAQDLDPARCLVAVNGHKVGRKGYRVVAVEPELWPWVSGAVPCPVKYKWLREHFIRTRDKLKLTGLTMYDLRHLSAQLATDKGASLRDVSLHMGHQNVQQTMRYARRKAIQGVAKAIGEGLKR